LPNIAEQPLEDIETSEKLRRVPVPNFGFFLIKPETRLKKITNHPIF
jgi:hypothetical protein